MLINLPINSIQAQNIQAFHAKDEIFSDLNFELKLGETLALLGPNGCGKTTLLRCLTGLHRVKTGEVLVNQQAIDKLSGKQRAKLISYVPQYHRLAFGYAVIDMVLMGVMAGSSEFARASKQQIQQAEFALEQLSIADLAGRSYTELSGGQRQLVLIARALAQDTDFILLDEPTNGLDFGNQIKLLDKLADLSNQQRGILLTTHHPQEALRMANRAVLMRDGCLIADGDPTELLTQQGLAELYQLQPEQLANFGLKF